MDPAKLQTLDPKLQEAYKRVMSTNTVPKSSPPPPPMAQPPQVQQPAQAPQTTLPEAPVMNQSVPAQANPAIQTAAPFPPISPAAAIPNNPITPPIQQQAPSPQMNTMPFPGLDASASNQQMQAYVADEVAGAKQSIKTIQLIYLVGGLVFFAVYALFWMKFFNVASPF
jgi:hypothetical protein